MIHEQILREMIDEGVRIATSSASSTEGWTCVLKPGGVIAIKVDPIGHEVFRTTDAFVGQTVQAVNAAGVPLDHIMLVDAPSALTKRLKTRVPLSGWSDREVSPGGRGDRLAAWLAEADGIVNISFLKTHSIAGIAGCVFNMSLGIVRQPKQYYADACLRAADILALPQVKPKLRLNIVNGLRANFDGGPLLRPQSIWPHRGILVGTDPVAVDHIATDIIDEQCKAHGFAPLGDRDGRIPHVHAAALAGLGTDDQDFIDLVRSDFS